MITKYVQWSSSRVNFFPKDRPRLQIISQLAPVKLSSQTFILLGHIPILAGQTSLMPYHYKSAPFPFTWCLNMEQVSFQSICCTWASISMQEKWNAWYNIISMTFVHTTTASVLRLIYWRILLVQECFSRWLNQPNHASLPHLFLTSKA